MNYSKMRWFVVFCSVSCGENSVARSFEHDIVRTNVELDHKYTCSNRNRRLLCHQDLTISIVHRLVTLHSMLYSRYRESICDSYQP
jgi:hypothetical protein